MSQKQKFLKIDGRLIPVSEEVYLEYMRPWWKEKKRRRSRQNTERSIDFFDNGEDENELVPADETAIVEKIVEDKLMLEALYKALDLLSEKERYIIDQIYFNGRTERDMSEILNIPKTGLHRQKEKILKKLKSFL